MRRERGQAAVELVAVAPLLVLALLGLAQLVLALRADLAAGRAAERGLAAAYAGGDVRGAALAGLGGARARGSSAACCGWRCGGRRCCRCRGSGRRGRSSRFRDALARSRHALAQTFHTPSARLAPCSAPTATAGRPPSPPSACCWCWPPRPAPCSGWRGPRARRRAPTPPPTPPRSPARGAAGALRRPLSAP